MTVPHEDMQATDASRYAYNGWNLSATRCHRVWGIMLVW